MQSRARGGDDLRTNKKKIGGAEDEVRTARPHPHAPRDPTLTPHGTAAGLRPWAPCSAAAEWRCGGVQAAAVWRCWGVRLPLCRSGGCSLASFLVVVA